MSLAAAQMPSRTQRRRQRLERELRALHAMQGHMRFWDIIWSVLAIPLLALLGFAIALKLHWVSGSPAFAVVGALVGAGVIWWIGRRWFGLALLIVFALLLIVLESGPDWFDLPGKGKKPLRAEKLAQAISKREALLRNLNGAKP
jgi:hypothetical protein